MARVGIGSGPANDYRQNWDGASQGQAFVSGESALFSTSGTDISIVGSFTVGSITFSNTAGVYTSSGDALTLNSGIANNSSALQTFNNAFTLGGVQTWNAAAGSLYFGGLVNVGGNALTLAGSSSSTITLAGGLTNTSGGALIVNSSGTARITAGTIFTGNTTVSEGTLELAVDAALAGTGQITIEQGGTLLFSGAAGNRINNSAAMTLAGGTFHTAGLSESLGALTLSGDSTINLGGIGSTLSFTSGTYDSGALTVENWSGSLAGGGTDQLRFNSPLSPTFLANINFAGFGTGATQLSFSGYYEVVPVPEPVTLVGCLALMGWVTHCERRRLASWLRGRFA